MNLLAKKLSLSNILKPGLMMLISVFFGCETEKDLGIKYELDSDASVKFKEFVLPATNIRIDSLRTDGEGKVLVGNYSDALIGKVSAEAYFKPTYEKGPLPRKWIGSDGKPTSDTLKLDSVAILFESNTILPNQNVPQAFKVYELADTVESGFVYLSNLKLNLGDEIGSFAKATKSAIDTLYQITLTDTYAQRLFNQLSDIAGDSAKSKNSDNIKKTIFKSIGLIPDADSESITSMDLLNDTTRMIMYTSPATPVPNAKDTSYLTYFTFTSKNYSYLKRDRSGSPFDGIEEKKDFDLATGQTIISPLAGLTTSFSIKELSDFFSQNENILINSARLSLEFEPEQKIDALTSVMNYLRKTDKGIFGPAFVTNQFDNIVMSDNGYLRPQFDPSRSTLNDDKNELSMANTLFYQQLYRQYFKGDSLAYQNPQSGKVRTINDLVLISPTNATLQRTIFKKDGVKLRLYYTEVDQ